MQQQKIKTMQEWEERAKENESSGQYSWYDFAEPGDLVDRSVFNHFLNVVPPKKYGSGFLQVGEAYSRAYNEDAGKMADTFMTFEKVEDGIYRYCGNCFLGKTDHIE